MGSFYGNVTVLVFELDAVRGVAGPPAFPCDASVDVVVFSHALVAAGAEVMVVVVVVTAAATAPRRHRRRSSHAPPGFRLCAYSPHRSWYIERVFVSLQ